MEKRIAERQSSGMTVKAWCKQNQLCEQTYYKYLKQLRQELCDHMHAPVTHPEKSVVFQNLEVQTPFSATRPAVIIRLSSATLEAREGTSQQTIQAEPLALQSVCQATSPLPKISISLVVIQICVNPLMD